MRDTRAEFQAPMWKALAETKPDLLFLLGDNVYVDDEANITNNGVIEERIWRRYVETRVTLDLYHLKTLIPSLAIWDDHDFGLNNSYGNTPWRGAATDVFRTLYAQDAIMPEVTWGPGIATAFTAYGQRFYLMDNRSFRGHPILGRDHWGGEQEEWLLSGLNTHAHAGWILSGSQIFGGYRSGWSYETQHPLSLKRMLNKIKNVKAPVLFGTGDVHYSEIMKVEKELLGYDTIEITSSSMHSNAKEPRKGNKRRIASIGEFNFVVTDVNVLPAGLELALRSHGSENKQFFEVDQIKITR
jgi:phosphodiesterase/alkaline phosphatase D-like protein